MNHLLSALERLNCAELTHDEWVRVGMALKAEGYDVSVWDAWSSRDSARYHAGECQRRWNSFRGSSVPVTGATIIKLAQDHGWRPFAGEDGCMDWNDVIEYDGSASEPDPEPVSQSGSGSDSPSVDPSGSSEADDNSGTGADGGEPTG